jgi:transcriptional regulator with XRE-family HTH domain
MPSSTTELAAFAQRLQKLRHAYAGAIDLPELSAAEFARILGVPLASYESYEHGDNEPSMSVLVLLHRKTGVSLDWLMADEPGGRPMGRGLAGRARPTSLAS